MYYSVGGGFVVAGDESGEKRIVEDATALPLPFHTGAELLAICAREQLTIAGVMRRNERAWREDAAIDAGLLHIWQVMQAVREARLLDARRAARRIQGASAAHRGCSRSSTAIPRRHCATSWSCSTG